MEFGEKLQALRKSRGMTQEELAAALYVSRTAVSKWESGRGYPSIDSLKVISAFFSVTIDTLLSGEKLISIAEQENRSSLQRLCEQLFGMADLLSVLLIILPLYPETVNGYINSVSLLAYAEVAVWIRAAYWVIFSALMLSGAVKIFLIYTGVGKAQKAVTGCSVVLGILAVFLLALSGETYAVIVAFLLLLIKGMLLFRYGNANRI